MVSSAPASTPAADTQSATPLYRPAPEFGAYGPTPTQPEQSASNTAQQGAQPTQQFPYGQAFPQQPQGQRNPYFTNNQQQGNSNPFNPQPQQPATRSLLQTASVRVGCLASALAPARRTARIRRARKARPNPIGLVCPRRQTPSSLLWSPRWSLRLCASALATRPSLTAG